MKPWREFRTPKFSNQPRQLRVLANDDYYIISFHIKAFQTKSIKMQIVSSSITSSIINYSDLKFDFLNWHLQYHSFLLLQGVCCCSMHAGARVGVSAVRCSWFIGGETEGENWREQPHINPPARPLKYGGIKAAAAQIYTSPQCLRSVRAHTRT